MEALIRHFVNTDNQVTGISHTLNRYLVLTLKCFQLRRRRKLYTSSELLLPIIVFYYAMRTFENIYPITKSSSNKFSDGYFDLKTLNSLSAVRGRGMSSPELHQFYKTIYYDYNNSAVDMKLLENVFRVFSAQGIGFESTPQNITDKNYMVVTFTVLNSSSIDYFLKEVAPNQMYTSWLNPHQINYNLKTRNPADLFHQTLLQAFSSYLNPDIMQYHLTLLDDLHLADLVEESKLQGPKAVFYNRNIFLSTPIAIFIAFVLNSFLVLTWICEEKKTRSLEFLKLMSATDKEIFFGHFIDHFLIWLAPLAICFFYLLRVVPLGGLPFDVFIILLMYSLILFVHTICFMFLLSAPFKRYFYAELVFIVTTFASYQYTTEHPDNFLSQLMLAHPIVSMNKFQDICANSLSVQFNFTESLGSILTYSSHEKMSLLNLFSIIILIVIVELLLTNYIIQVNPFQNGMSKPFLYFLQSSYWREETPISEYVAPKQREFEEVSSTNRPAIIIKDVDKSYRSWYGFGSKFPVLKCFNFAVYEKQITVLLGHNGAGKTTTMDLIAGLSSVDNGSITTLGHTVSPYNTGYKQALGYCPQENIFYELLTVRQNLLIAGVLKGSSFASLKNIIPMLTAQFDLQSKLSERAQNLSGGMKRRLCLAMSIIGYCNVLVIDEPTSGLDPENRRKVWEIMLQLRKYKTILLTTHFLEEADILGDSIAIMHSGKVKCCGSTMFLKNLYHVGYLLRLELSKEIKETVLLNLIRRYVPDASYERCDTNEHFIRLTLSQTKKEDNLNLMIANLLDLFERPEICQEFGIQAYGLTNTTLEDVFIKIGTLDLPKEDVIAVENVEDHPLYNLTRVDGFALYAQQLKAIICKKIKLFIRNIASFFSLLYMILLPVIILLFVTATVNQMTPSLTKLRGLVDFKWNLEGTELLIVNHSLSNQFDLFKESNDDWLHETFGLDIVRSNFTNFSQAVKEEGKQIGFDSLGEKLLLVLERINETSYEFHYNPKKYPYNLIGSLEFFYRAIAREANKDFNIHFEFQIIDPTHKPNDDIDLPIDTSFDDVFMNVLNLYVASQIFFGMALSIAISFPFVSFVELPNEEMENGAFDMQIIAGLSKSSYWFGNFVFDYLCMIIVVLLSCILLFMFDKLSIFSSSIAVLFLVLILGSLSCLLVTYFLVNLNLKKSMTDLIIKYSIFTAGIAIAVYDAIYLTIFVVFSVMTKQQEDKDYHGIPSHFGLMIFSPAYNVIDVFFHYWGLFMYDYCVKNAKSEHCALFTYRDFDLKMNLLAFFITSTIFITLIVFLNFNLYFVKKFIEYLKLRLLSQPFTQLQQAEEVQIETNYLIDLKDPNVTKEKELVQMLIETNNLQSNILVVHDLLKMFGSFVAVDHLNFTVRKAECFGLLGVNGAGKTTTFKMIGGSHLPTTGTIVLDGFSFGANPHEYYRRLGYCPQENTHTNHITVTDNLRFYARINGIPSQLIERAIRTLIEECDLQNHKSKATQHLSGGNKRKLSTAIALIGRKDLILLDEPTTGVDPVARRKLWKTFDFYKQKLQTSFILTSHSMDEVENLCSRISIMVAGKFKAMGSFSYLKEKYSQGFTITIRIKESNKVKAYIDALKERMHQDFEGNAKMKEFYMKTMVFIIMSKTFAWGQLFRAMEKIKSEFELEDFLVSETNLEAVFLSFAQNK